MPEPTKPLWRRAALIAGLMIIAGVGGFYLGRSPMVVYSRAQDIAQNRTHEYVNTWMGVKVLQYPNDLMVYQQIIAEQGPDWIIETGTSAAGLTLYLSNVLQASKPEGRIITVDIDPEGWNFTTKQMLKNPNVLKLLERIEFIEGSSAAPEVLDKIKQRIGTNTKVMVILDALHTKEHVLNELKLYSELLHPGEYLIVTDTHLDKMWGEPGPKAAVEAFLQSRSDFALDRSRDRFIISANIAGWLRKKQ